MCVLQLEVFIFKLGTINGLTTGASAMRKVTLRGECIVSWCWQR